jgi:ABC-2 type transport system permease protein
MTGRRAIALVAGREIRERLRGRTYLVSTVVLLLLVGASTAASSALDATRTYDVAVVGPAPPRLQAALDAAAEPFDVEVRQRAAGSQEAARSLLEDEEVDAVLLVGDEKLVFSGEVDTELAAIVDASMRAARGRAPPAPELTAVALDPQEAEASDAETLVALVAALLLLMSLAVYGQWVIGGVLEEKSSRVIELVMSTVRARDLLAGKVIGIGLLGLAQLVLVAGLGAALLVAGVFDAPRELGGSLVLVVPWFALGFGLYAVAYATAGALASRQQNADTAGQPVTYALVAAYFAGYIAVSADDDGMLATLLTVFPLSAPLVLPARSALVGVPLWQHALAVVLVLASTYALVRLAGRVYANGLLAGAGLDPRAALRLSRRS